uniref:Uncharacterized protein LOC107616612 n=1 Tax=Rhizophora mucronata TaxID=61149 RepID=A0A2P2KGR0_RHIMU
MGTTSISPLPHLVLVVAARGLVRLQVMPLWMQCFKLLLLPR